MGSHHRNQIWQVDVPLNRSRVDVILVPMDVDLQVTPKEWSAALLRWQASGLVIADCPTSQLVEGGAQGIRLDRPARPVVYGNQLGGFRVFCPQCRSGLAREFASAMEAARLADPLKVEITCPSCGLGMPLTTVQARPPIRIGRCAVILIDVVGVTLTDEGRAAIRSLLGPMATVFRRTS